MGFPGPGTVSKLEASADFYGHDVAFTVYYPNETKPAPLIVFNTGWNQPRSTNEAYCQQLAQWGMVVINRQYPSFLLTTFVDRHVEHCIAVTDWALAQNADPTSELYGRIDPDRIGVTGYSLGAGVALMAPLEDDRIKTCVALDAVPRRNDELGSVDYVKYLDIPTLFIQSGVLGIMNSDLPLYESTPPPCMEVTMEGASHMQFEDNIVGLNVIGLLLFPGADADPLVTRTLAVKYMVSWFKVYLEGDPGFQKYLTGPESDIDVDAGLISVLRNLDV